MTDYERGRLAGFAEGVEAAAKAINFHGATFPREDYRGCPDWSCSSCRHARAILALRAPSPVTYRGRCPEGIPGCMCQEDADPDPAPSPKEDAPRCEACDDGAVVFQHTRYTCDRCGGTGRSTTGGGR